MSASAAKKDVIEALRARIEARFPDAGMPGVGALGETPGEALPSGVATLDAALRHGGLRAGEALRVRSDIGAGALGLASCWAREASRRGEPVLVVDARGETLPHAWVEPEDARAPIWVVSPADPAEAWPALDVGLRSGAFGLALLVDPPAAPRGAGPRLARLLRDRHGRLLLLGAGPVGMPRERTLELSSLGARWEPSLLGAIPVERRLLAREVFAPMTVGPTVELCRDDLHTDRLRPAPRMADRRPAQRTSEPRTSGPPSPRAPSRGPRSG